MFIIRNVFMFTPGVAYSNDGHVPLCIEGGETLGESFRRLNSNQVLFLTSKDTELVRTYA